MKRNVVNEGLRGADLVGFHEADNVSLRLPSRRCCFEAQQGAFL